MNTYCADADASSPLGSSWRPSGRSTSLFPVQQLLPSQRALEGGAYRSLSLSPSLCAAILCLSIYLSHVHTRHCMRTHVHSLPSPPPVCCTRVARLETEVAMAALRSHLIALMEGGRGEGGEIGAARSVALLDRILRSCPGESQISLSLYIYICMYI